MSREDVAIEFDREPPEFWPDESLSGNWTLHVHLDIPVRAVELSVLWYTDGTGDEDLGIHHFERLPADEGGMVAPGQPRRFAVRLPRSPLSYDGVLVKVRWCVRVRVFRDGADSLAEAAFRLGAAAPAREVPP